MSCSLVHLLQIVKQLEDKGINLVSSRENIDITSATGKIFYIIGAIPLLRCKGKLKQKKLDEKLEYDQKQILKSWNKLVFWNDAFNTFKTDGKLDSNELKELRNISRNAKAKEAVKDLAGELKSSANLAFGVDRK